MKKLSYTITPVNDGFVFTVEDQSAQINAALADRNYIAKNGWRISTDEGPAIDVDTKTIYLRGFNRDIDFRNVRVYTRNSARVINEIDSALAEFVKAIQVPRIPLSRFRITGTPQLRVPQNECYNAFRRTPVTELVIVY